MASISADLAADAAGGQTVDDKQQAKNREEFFYIHESDFFNLFGLGRARPCTGAKFQRSGGAMV